jgi:energy-coupling factor transporter ATP-binding protein EcfA2
VDLDLPDGSVIGLAGAAETGKTTLCLVAGGLAPRVVGGHLVGDITLDGQDVSRWPMHRLAEQVVTGLQDPAGQLSHIADTVFDEVAFGPANLGLPTDQLAARAEEALERIGIGDLAARDPLLLSGGQQQLVVLAGLLAMRPRHLVLDEPVAHLDATGTRSVLQAIAAIAETGTAVLLAEQRTEALVAVCDRLAVMADGNVVADGPVDEVLAEPSTAALGVEEPADVRLRRLLTEAGLDPGLAEAPR